MAHQTNSSPSSHQRRQYPNQHQHHSSSSASSPSTTPSTLRHHHWNSLSDVTPTPSPSSTYTVQSSAPSSSSTSSASRHDSSVLYSYQGTAPGQSSGGHRSNNGSTHSKHTKHSSRGRDDVQLQQSQQSNSSSNGNGSFNSSNTHDRPSIQQAVKSIPPMLRRGNGTVGNTINSTLGEDVMLQDWLHKRSSSLQLVWKRRWCVLRDGQLRYYRSNTDTRPIGVIHLADHSVLTSGPDVSRKSKHAFRLSAPEPIPHQNQNHLFFTESALSLQNWTHALQAHIDHAAATWASLAAASDELRLQLMRDQQALDGRGGQSIIDKVLERLQLEDSTASQMSNDRPSMPTTPDLYHTQHSRTPPVSAGTVGTAQGRLPHLPANFPVSHEDNNDTWSSTSSLPANNASTNTTTSLDHIFAQQGLQQPQTSKSSMDSMRDVYSAQPSPLGLHASGSCSQFNQNGSDANIIGYPPGNSFMDHSSVSDASRSSVQSDYQGRTSLQHSRVVSKNNMYHTAQSPRMYPLRSSAHSNTSLNNGVPSPAASAVASPYSSPVLTSQPNMMSGSLAGSTAPSSPRVFYKILEGSPSRRTESIASFTSISTIASEDEDVSTINDLASDNGLCMTNTQHSQGKSNGGSSHGSTFLGLVTGGKYKKDRGSSAGSSHSGSASPALKLFGSGMCSFSGCAQPAKTCVYHKKKNRMYSPMSDDRKGKGESKEKKSKKPWSSGSDLNVSQSSTLAVSTSHLSNHSDSSPCSSYTDARSCGNGLSKSMVSLSKDSELEIETGSVSLLNSQLYLMASPTRKRSPSAPVTDSNLDANLQPMDNYPAHSRTPPPVPTPSHRLPLPPPRATCAASNYHPQRDKESPSLSRKIGLQIGGDFGALDQNPLLGTALNGNFFVANHHRTMQKLQTVQTTKSQPINVPPTLTERQQQQDALDSQLQAGVSRHIVAPDVLAMAIEREAEKLRQQHAQENEAQKKRPTSMIKHPSYQSISLQLSLSTVSETSSFATTDENDSAATSLISSPKSSQDGERIISSEEQLAFAAPGLTATMKAPTSPISSITVNPLSPVSSAPLPPTALRFTKSDLATSDSDEAKRLQQQPSRYGSTPVTPTRPPEVRDFPMHSLPPPKRHWNEPTAYHHGVGLGRVGKSRQRSISDATLLRPLDADTDVPNGQDKASFTTTSSLRPGFATRRQSSSAVMIRLTEQGAQNISPLLNNGTTTTFVGDVPSNDVRRPGLTPISSTSGSSFSTSTVSPSLSFVTSRHAGHEHHINGTEESSMTSVETDQHFPTTPALSPSSEVSSPTLYRSRTFRSVSSPLAAITPASNSPSGSPSTLHTQRMEGPSIFSIVEPSTPGATEDVPVVELESKDSRAISNHHSAFGKESVSPKRVLATASSFVFPAPSVRRTRYDASGRPLSTCSTSSFMSEDGAREGEDEDGSGPTSDRSGPSSRAESPVLSSSLHAAALELYPSLRKFSLFTAAVGGHPPPALLTRRKDSAGSVASSTRDHHSVAPSGLSHMDNGSEGDDGVESYEEDWAGNLKSTRLLKERRASLPISPSLLSLLPSRLSSPPPSNLLSHSGLPYPRTSPPSPTTPPATPMALSYRPAHSVSIPFASQNTVPKPFYAMPDLDASGQSSSGSLVDATSPPAVPQRSPHRNLPTTPTTSKAPRSIHNLPNVPIAHSVHDRQRK
ncbi:MAG: hypothetical protein J3Q66DRAFT_171330 [Benniella sp.]|nr:MAG: hypothetical protein J3Q66DRAFT_171330 [Benniella sp.]